MLKKGLLIFFLLLLLLTIAPAIYFLDSSQSGVLSSTKVAYDLPYPGILPDHPLYVVKIVRDRIMEFVTRDNNKKAELYLLLSDKRTAMATELAKKGKDMMALSTLSKAEKYFLKIPSLLRDSKKQGTSPSSEFVQRLRLSNAKHKETAELLLKELPQGSSEIVNQILRLNDEIRKELDRL